MDHSTAIQKQIANTGEKLVEIARELDEINRNLSIQSMEKDEKQKDCVIEALAYCYKFYDDARLCHFIPSDFDKLSKKSPEKSKRIIKFWPKKGREHLNGAPALFLFTGTIGYKSLFIHMGLFIVNSKNK